MHLAIHNDPEALSQRTRALKKLKSMNVKAGLPASAGGRLRFILAVQEHGSPIMHIPARPVIRPALAKPETRSAMAEAMRGPQDSVFAMRDVFEQRHRPKPINPLFNQIKECK